MRRANRAPRTGTILVATLLTVFAALAFFSGVLPATIAGVATATLALYAGIAAFLLMLLGTLTRGL
jgi:hypothetical protein